MTRMPTIDQTQQLPCYGYPAFIRQHIIRLIHESFPDETAGFSAALLIGNDDGIDYETDIAFKVSGISHIIAVSGFHVSVLFSLVHTLLGRKRWLSALVGLPVLFFFAAVAGFSASITRACIMHSLMIIATLFDKEYDPLTSLSFAVLCMLVINPWTVANVSFQLSVFCMLGILTLAEPIKQWIMERKFIARVRGKVKKLAGGLASSVGMSIGATVFVTPFCAHYFGMVSLLGVLTNLLTLWVITIIFYGIMFACLAVLLWQPLGSVCGAIISVPIRYVLGVSKLIASFPLTAVYTARIFIVLWLIFVYILLLINLIAKRKHFLLTGCCAVIGLCIALMASWTIPQQDECRVTVLDVGQGQCILLQSDGKTYMVDCGGDVDTQVASIAAQELMSQGVFRLDGLILTHYDRDHAAGVAYLLSRIPTDMLYLPNCTDEDGTLSSIERSDFNGKLFIDRITDVSFGNTDITLIPSKRDLSDKEAGLCVLFQTENCDILITGDRSTSGERELMHQIVLPELEVLIVGHHGSKYSTGQALLDQTSPEIAIISVGGDNLYGHPAEETLRRLQEAGCEIYRTDLYGTVVYRG